MKKRLLVLTLSSGFIFHDIYSSNPDKNELAKNILDERLSKLPEKELLELLAEFEKSKAAFEKLEPSKEQADDSSKQIQQSTKIFEHIPLISLLKVLKFVLPEDEFAKYVDDGKKTIEDLHEFGTPEQIQEFQKLLKTIDNSTSEQNFKDMIKIYEQFL